MYESPLKEFSRTDFFDKTTIHSNMAEYKFDYFFCGKRIGSGKNLIDLFVVTWIMDDAENLSIR